MNQGLALLANTNFSVILPEIVLAAAGLVLLLAEAFLPPRGRPAAVGGLAVLGALAALAALFRTPVGVAGLGGTVWSDGFAMFFRAVLLVILAMVVLMSVEFVERRRIPAGEFYALLAFATVGAMFMAISADLIAFYVGLELLSISSYVLAGFLRGDARSGEAAIKYFLTGAMASGILLFGMSVLLGLTGSTNLREVAGALSSVPSGPALFAALVLLTGGLGFKLGAVPFHLWVPDTYQGAPTPVTAFLSVGSKGAAVAAFLRVFFVGLDPVKPDWGFLLAAVSALTMTVGNVAALHQRNVKRLLAYSSVAQAGYIMAALAAANSAGFSAAMYYVAAYAFMNVGAFAVLVALANQGEGEELDDLAGLARREPVLGFLMFLFLLSLLGIPPLAGFWAKFFVFRAAVDAGLVWLAVALALNSAISVGYYYAVVKAMYVSPVPEERAGRPVAAGVALQVGLALAAAGVIVLGLMPETFLGWATLAAQAR